MFSERDPPPEFFELFMNSETTWQPWHYELSCYIEIFEILLVICQQPLSDSALDVYKNKYSLDDFFVNFWNYLTNHIYNYMHKQSYFINMVQLSWDIHDYLALLLFFLIFRTYVFILYLVVLCCVYST